MHHMCRSLAMTGTVYTRPSQVTVWVDPPLLCLDVLVVESTPRLLMWVLTLWARLRRTFLRMTHVTLPPLLVSPCSKYKLSISDCLISQLRMPEHWHHMLLRSLIFKVVMFLCSKTFLCPTCILGRLLFLWPAFVSCVEVPNLKDLCHRVGVCACQQKYQVQHVFQPFERLQDYDLFGGIRPLCLDLLSVM